MQIEVGTEYLTRDGRRAKVLRPIQRDNGGKFVRQELMCDYAVSVEGRLERYNGDGSYIRKAIIHPLDLVSAG